MTEWIVTSSALILIVIALRGILKNRITARLRYGLWLLVLVRLLIPLSFTESAMSLGNVTQQIEKQPTVQQTTQDVHQYESAYDRILDQYAQLGIPVTPDQIREEARDQVYTDTYEHISSDYESQGIPVTDTQLRQETQQRLDAVQFRVTAQEVLPVIWYTGMVLVGLALILSNLRFGATLVRSRKPVSRDKLPVYVSDAVATPCLFGLPFPAIYLTREAMEDSRTMNHVLTHEMSHYRQGDHIWSVLRLVSLVLHWYNPLVWLAVHLSKRDGEMACDEATLKLLGEDERAAYGRTLIGMTCLRHDPRNLLLSATTMIGSKKSLAERIRGIARKTRPTVLALIACLVVMAIAVGCTFTGAPTEPTDPTEPSTAPTDPTTEPTTEPITEPTTEPTAEPTEPIEEPIRYPSGEGLNSVNNYGRVYPTDSPAFIYDPSQAYGDWKTDGYECVTGHAYVKHSVSKEIVPLADGPAVYMHTIADHVFVSTESGQLIHFSYLSGEPRVLYTARWGTISAIGYYNNGTAALVYFTDGNYILSYDLYTDVLREVTLFEGVTFIGAFSDRMLVRCGATSYAYDLLSGQRVIIQNSQIDAFIYHGQWPLPWELTEQIGTLRTLFIRTQREDGFNLYDIYHTDVSLPDWGGNFVPLPANYTVEDLVKPWGKDMDWGTGTEQETITCSLPYIIPFSADAVAAQQEINDWLGQDYAYMLFGSGPRYLDIRYDATLNGNILSVQIWHDSRISLLTSYLVYNFDLTTGKLLTNAEMLERYLPEVSYPAYCMAVCKLREDSYQRYAEEMTGNKDMPVHLAYAVDELLSAELYLDAQGQLHLAFNEATIAGAGWQGASILFPPTDTDWPMPGTQEAYEWLFGIVLPDRVSDDSIKVSAYKEMLANAYLADPEGFESYLAREDAETQARVEATGFREEASILAGNLSLPENYTLEDLVAAYNEHLEWADKMLEPHEFTLSMPLIYPFSDDAVAVQQLISSRCTTILEEEKYARNNAISSTMKYVGYEVYLNDDVLSLVMEYRYPYGSNFVVFNFDLTTGKLISNADMVQRYLDVSYPEFLLAVRNFRDAEVMARYPEYPIYEEHPRNLHVFAMDEAVIYPTQGGKLELRYYMLTAGGQGFFDTVIEYPGLEFDFTRRAAYQWLFGIEIMDDYNADHNREDFTHMLRSAYRTDPEEFEYYLSLEDAATQAKINAYPYR